MVRRFEEGLEVAIEGGNKEALRTALDELDDHFRDPDNGECTAALLVQKFKFVLCVVGY